MKNRLILIIGLLLISDSCFAGILLMQYEYQKYKSLKLQMHMDSIYNVGNKLFNKNLYHESTPYICEYAEFQKGTILSALFHGVSEEGRNQYWAKYRDIYTRQIPFLAYYHNADTLVSKALDSSIFSKGILLNTSITLKQAIIKYKPTLLETYNRFEKLDTECQKIFESKQEINKEMSYLFQQRDSLDEILYKESQFFLDVVESLSVSWKDILSVLEDKDVAVDFAEIPLEDKDMLYVAFVVKPSYESPQMIPLLKKSELPISNQYPIVDESIAYFKIWAPLENLLRGSENIYFSPTGILNRIAIEYLPDKRGLPISWLYNMHRLSNLRELVMDNDSTTSVNRVGLIGGLDYDESAIPINNKNVKKKHRGAAREYCAYLPSSLTEVQDIKAILEEQSIQTELFTGCDMPEDSVSHFEKNQYDILHFATHGFFFDKQIGDSVDKQIIDALSCSGIVLSGANEYFSSWLTDQSYTSTPDDNILTSLEISKMNLTNVNMVVLSACVSGLGFENLDGLYGLQRAFKKAGVRSQLVSLWNIDDEATSIFVTSFYRYYIQTDDMFRALKLAQQALCLAHNGRYNHPKYWATFILIDGIDHNKQGLAVGKKKVKHISTYFKERKREVQLEKNAIMKKLATNPKDILRG